jgi:Tfp pilus assembly protein PilW
MDRNRQHGFSLISLMVGLIISVVVTLGLLSVYRNSIQVTAQATTRTIDDSQLSSLLIRTGATIQDAGYGINAPAYGTHIVAISGATLTGTTLSGTAAVVGTQANAVVWAMLTGATTQCAGFYAPAAGGLMYLSPVNCTNAAAWASLPWQSSWVAQQTTAALQFTISAQTCSPYGITSTTGSHTITLSTTNSIHAGITSLQCLINIQT